ncbi:hypothetical protein ABL78_7925 [Leptomonas seymouri]|uniref:Uncharacterized protein n=1 Tax=Leptomonas seymouri TaxID=5684 RepID=A0A0N0P2K6_LEPSE|nr:hypothetical protein ABL78_7925 [Leptomonas seymouri]|eukprot:KPI83059.1 hypothetical protein ABL78_7925 [Leptomonas seymouri]
MATLLCASCGHSFPENLLEPISFSDRVGRYLTQTSQLVRETRGKTSEDTHRLVQLGQLLQQLCGMMEEEVHILQGHQKEPRGGGTRVGASTAKKTSSDMLALGPSSQRDDSAAMNGAPGGTSRQQPQMMMTNATTLDRTAGTSSLRMFDGTVPSYQLKRMVSAFDLVSATLYNVLESLAVQCRAGVALLWLRPRQNSSSDLVAPFVVGRELAALAHSAPYSTPEASVPCVVCQTGVALNLMPQPHPPAATNKGLAEDLSLTELMEQTNAAQLLMPVHNRYTERNAIANTFSAAAGGTSAPHTSVTPAGYAPVIAVVHLIGSPLCPVPFHRHNEEATAQVAELLSYILSSYYEAMIAEWANRFFMPTTLHATAKYTAALDMRPEEKAVDDFTAQPLLIYRTNVSDPRELQSANEARDALKLLQQSAVRKSTSLRPMTNMKDLCQHAANMEANWVSAVQQIARLEKEVGTLEEDLLRRDVGALQRAQDYKLNSGMRRSSFSSPSNARATCLSETDGGARRSPQTVTQEAAAVTTPLANTSKSLTSLNITVELTPAVPYAEDSAASSRIAAAGNSLPISGNVLKPEEMELLEAVSLQRLKRLGADTAIFESTS